MEETDRGGMQEHEKTCLARSAKGTVKNAVSLQSISSIVIPSDKLSGREKRRRKTVEETDRRGMQEHDKTRKRSTAETDDDKDEGGKDFAQEITHM